MNNLITNKFGDLRKQEWCHEATPAPPELAGISRGTRQPHNTPLLKLFALVAGCCLLLYLLFQYRAHSLRSALRSQHLGDNGMNASSWDAQVSHLQHELLARDVKIDHYSKQLEKLQDDFQNSTTTKAELLSANKILNVRLQSRKADVQRLEQQVMKFEQELLKLGSSVRALEQRGKRAAADT